MALPGTYATPMTVGGIVGAALGIPVGGAVGAVRFGLIGSGVGFLVGLARSLDKDNPDTAVPEIWQRDTRQSALQSDKAVLPPGIMEEGYRVDPSQYEGWGRIPIGDVGELWNPQSRPFLAEPPEMGWDAQIESGAIADMEATSMNFMGVTPMNQEDLLVLYDWISWLAYNYKYATTGIYPAGDMSLQEARANAAVQDYKRRLIACGNTAVGTEGRAAELGTPSQMVCGLRVIRAMTRGVEGENSAMEAVVQRIARNYWENVEKPLLGQGSATIQVPADLVGAVSPPPPAPSSSGGASEPTTFSNPETDFRVALWERRGVKIGAGVLGAALLITIIAMAASNKKPKKTPALQRPSYSPRY